MLARELRAGGQHALRLLAPCLRDGNIRCHRQRLKQPLYTPPSPLHQGFIHAVTPLLHQRLTQQASALRGMVTTAKVCLNAHDAAGCLLMISWAELPARGCPCWYLP